MIAQQTNVAGVSYPTSQLGGETWSGRPSFSYLEYPAGVQLIPYSMYTPSVPTAPGLYSTVDVPPYDQFPRTPVNRHRFRTKPCKFFKPGSTCAKGDSCSLIHADADKDNNCESKLQHPKPWSNKTEKMRKGYFPVSWRVIGGGVRLSSGTGAPSQSHFRNARVVADGQAGPARV
ncbi:hypothetical protein B0H14DRAFT_2833561 [Mycena olivaceomarginata]|nr:hypothetical protein B0H14DRAFT_2833561 [Mycena olivaceomarginata]